MKDYTFIFMLYYLDPINSIGVTSELQRYNEMADLLLSMPLRDNNNYILIDTKNENAPGTNQPYRNTKIKLIENKGGGGNKISNTWANFGVRNIGNGDSLAGIFLLLKKNFPAKKYVLFTHNHSNFSGHLRSRIVVEAQIKQFLKTYISANLNVNINSLMNTEEGGRTAITNFILPELPDFRNPEVYDMLTNAELSNAIRVAFVLNENNTEQQTNDEDNRIEALFVDSCYTAAIDNLYLYAESCKHIVASEGIINYNSFNISRILERIYEGNSMENVLKSTIYSFRDDFEELSHHAGHDDYKRTLITAFSLSYDFKSRFSNAFNALLLDLIADIDFIAEFVKSLRLTSKFWKDCFSIYYNREPRLKDDEKYTFCIDFFSFFQDIYKLTAHRPYSHKVKTVLDLVRSSIISNYYGDEIEKDQFSGLSCFVCFVKAQLFEEHNKKKEIEHSYSFYSLFQNEFAVKSFWPEFIQILNKKLE